MNRSTLTLTLLIPIALLGTLWIGKAVWDKPIVENNHIPETDEDCQAAPTSPSGESAPPGPWDNSLEIISLSPDGESITGFPEVLVERGGVPTVIQDGEGRLVVAFQWFPCDNEERFDKVAVIISEDDGETWTDPELVEIEGLPDAYQRPFDPTLALTPEGQIRLYFTSSETGAKTFDEIINIYSALSDDGVHYTFEEGTRFNLDVPVYDSAAAYWQETWYLVTPYNEKGRRLGAYTATSEDGLNFTQQAITKSQDNTNWTGNFIVLGDVLRFYGSPSIENGLWWAETTTGSSWSTPEYLESRGGDPAVVCLEEKCLMITTGMLN